MEIFKSNKQSFKPVDRVIVFASDQSEKNYCDVFYVDRIENGRIITINEELVLPLVDAKPFTTNEGILYAYNVSLDYLQEVQHLAEVEKNIIISQAFLYPGRIQNEQKSSITNLIIIGIISLIAIIAIFT